MAPVRLQDIAERCNLSKSTVSRALRGDGGGISLETRERIREIAAEMGYDSSVHHAARRLALSKHGEYPLNHLIAAVFHPELLTTQYHLEIFRGVSEELMSQDFGMMLVYDCAESFNSLLPIFARGDVDGAIVTADPGGFQSKIKRLRGLPLFGRRPVVMLINKLPGCSAVVTNDEEGGFRAVSHLLELGHRHLAHFCWSPRAYPHVQRLAGYRRAYAGHGLDPDAHLHLMPWDYDHREAMKRDLLRYLEAHPEITGILATNDAIASLIHGALVGEGKRVPEDYSLIGYDDTDPLPAASGENLLTTVRLPLRQIGRTATRLVIKRLTGVVKSDQTVILPVEFVVRGSTGPAPR